MKSIQARSGKEYVPIYASARKDQLAASNGAWASRRGAVLPGLRSERRATREGGAVKGEWGGGWGPGGEREHSRSGSCVASVAGNLREVLRRVAGIPDVDRPAAWIGAVVIGPVVASPVTLRVRRGRTRARRSPDRAGRRGMGPAPVERGRRRGVDPGEFPFWLGSRLPRRRAGHLGRARGGRSCDRRQGRPRDLDSGASRGVVSGREP